MKAEQFDHYVRAQFEDDSVAPPARLESAVFAALEGQQRSRKGMLGAAALVLTAATSAALWIGSPAPAPATSTETVPASQEVIHAPAIANEEVAEPSFALPAAVNEPQSKPQPPASRQAVALSADASTSTQRPQPMEGVDARQVNGVAVENDSAPELQQTEKETWVLPAVVKVND